jgi:predicted nucleic acid-binding protein
VSTRSRSIAHLCKFAVDREGLGAAKLRSRRARRAGQQATCSASLHCFMRESIRRRPSGDRRAPDLLLDGQIAAVAVVNGLTLVTANVRDFRHLDALRVENGRE